MWKIFGCTGAALVGVVLLVALLALGMTGAHPKPPPGGCSAATAAAGSAGGPSAPTLNPEQLNAARQIAAVGKGTGVGERGVAIALATAQQESSLDPAATSPGGRSVGLFQQQGATYAGVDRQDPTMASAAFYQQLQRRVPNYNDPSVPIAEAAQRVQASGAGPGWYTRWEQWSTGLAHQLITGAPPAPGGDVAGGMQCAPGGGSGPLPVAQHGTDVDLPPQAGTPGTVHAGSPQAATAITAGLSYLGTPYAWGGGGPTGPTRGIRDGGVADQHGDFTKVGFDCSGLTQYAWAQARVSVTGSAAAQQSMGAGTRVPYSQAQPGDLLFYGSPAHHVAIYLGDLDGRPQMLEAPQSGQTVRVSPVRTGSDFQPTVVRPA